MELSKKDPSLISEFGDKHLMGFFDAKGIVTYANEPFRQRLGVGLDGTIDRSHEGFFSDQDHQLMLNTIKDCLKQPDIYVRIEMRSKIEEEKFYRWEFKTLTDYKGQVVGVHCNGYDITALRHEQARLLTTDMLADHLSDSVIITDMDFKIISWNKIAEEHYETPASEAVGKFFTEIIHYNQTNEEYEAMRQELMENGAWEGEVSYNRKDGSEQIVWIRSTMLRDKNGAPLGFVGIGRDITEKKKKEINLQLSSLILNNINDAVFATDNNNRVNYWNRSCEELYGIAADKAMGQKPEDLLPFAVIDGQISDILNSLNEKMEWQGKIAFTRKDGKSLLTKVTVRPIIVSKVPTGGFFTVLHDITQIEDSRSIMEKVFNTSFHAIYILDKQGIILDLNEKALQITGDDRQDRLGRHFLENRLFDLNPDLRNLMEMQLDWVHEGSLVNDKVEFQNYDGKEKTVNYTIRPVKDSSENVHLIILEMDDITDAVQNQKDILQKEILLHTYLDNSPLPSWIMDHHGRIQNMNQRFMDFFGLKIADMGKSLNQLIDPTFLHQYAENNRKVFETQQAVEVVEYAIDRNGSIHTFLNSKFPIINETGETIMIGVMGIDITDRLKAEEDKDKLLNTYQALTKAVKEVIWEWDVILDEFNWTNNEDGNWENQDNGQPRKLDNVFKDLNTQDRTRVEKSLRRAINDQKIDQWNAEYSVRDKDYNDHHYIDRAIILRDAQGKATRMIGFIQDITERVNLEKQLKIRQEEEYKKITRMIFEAQEAERTRIANDLHDNVNPLLAAARLYINVVESTLTEPEANLLQSKALIHEGIDEIRKISHNLSTTLIHEYSLEEVVENVLRKINPENHLKITTHFKGLENTNQDPNIKSNIVRIIQEQVNNTFKYAEAKNLHISLSQRSGMLHLTIEDDGRGFDTKATRSGIGLLNIRNRVESYQGKMKLISAPGQGCKLDVHLPTQTKQLNGK